MKTELLRLLRCPKTGQSLMLKCDEKSAEGVESGWLISEDGQHRYPIRNGIPRFVAQSNYADNFGMQWNHFRQTQLDSYSGHSISADRFWQATGWLPKDLRGQWVLDVGCGAGRFAEIALGAGATVVALDYSSAVDACYANLKDHPNLHVVQGDIYALPFQKQYFPFVYCLGVLQHTPKVMRAFRSLPPCVMEGGSLCVDFYLKSWKSQIFPKAYYLFRPVTKRMAKGQLFSLLQKWVPMLMFISNSLGRIPVIGVGLKRLVPVANYVGVYPLTAQQQMEWALLDTFDNLAPEYDQPQRVDTVRKWFEDAGFEQIETARAGLMVVRGKKPRLI